MAIQPRRALLVPLSPVLGAGFAVVILLIGLTLRGDELADAEPGLFSRAATWIALVPIGLLAYIAGTWLRREPESLRLLVSVAGGIAAAGLALLLSGLGQAGQTAPHDLFWPGSDIGRAGAWFMALAIAPALAAWDINYRRIDPWYVVPMGLVLGVWLVPLAALGLVVAGK